MILEDFNLVFLTKRLNLLLFFILSYFLLGGILCWNNDNLSKTCMGHVTV